MMESTINFDVPKKGRIEGLAFRRNPLDHGTFEAFRVISSSTGHPFAKLHDNKITY